MLLLLPDPACGSSNGVSVRAILRQNDPIVAPELRYGSFAFQHRVADVLSFRFRNVAMTFFDTALYGGHFRIQRLIYVRQRTDTRRMPRALWFCRCPYEGHDSRRHGQSPNLGIVHAALVRALEAVYRAVAR